MPSADPPLHGLRVLDLSTVVAGPFGAEVLGELGADVIRIEPPGPPPAPADSDRPITDAEGFLYALQRNKRALCLDLKHPRGKEIFIELVKRSDIVWDNFRPGVMQRLGLEHDALAAAHPGIITCSISGFGPAGPWSRVGAYDITIQALSGLMSITGDDEPGSEPARWGVPVGDIAGSLYGVIGVLAALDERLRTGRGQHVDIALLDAQLAMNTYRVPQAFGAGVKFAASSPRRGGAGAVPYGPFRACCGRWLTIAVASNFWRAFCAAIGRPDLAADPRFRTLADRQANQPALDLLLEQVMLERTVEQWDRIFLAAGVPAGLVHDIPGAFAQAQAVARDMRVTLVDRSGRKVPAAASPLRFEGEPARPQRAPSLRGADTHRILRELLALDDATIDALQAQGIAGTTSSLEASA